MGRPLRQTVLHCRPHNSSSCQGSKTCRRQPPLQVVQSSKAAAFIRHPLAQQQLEEVQKRLLEGDFQTQHRHLQA